MKAKIRKKSSGAWPEYYFVTRNRNSATCLHTEGEDYDFSFRFYLKETKIMNPFWINLKKNITEFDLWHERKYITDKRGRTLGHKELVTIDEAEEDLVDDYYFGSSMFTYISPTDDNLDSIDMKFFVLSKGKSNES